MFEFEIIKLNFVIHITFLNYLSTIIQTFVFFKLQFHKKLNYI